MQFRNVPQNVLVEKGISRLDEIRNAVALSWQVPAA